MNYKVIEKYRGGVTYQVFGADAGEGKTHSYEWLADQLDPDHFGWSVRVDSPDYIIIDVFGD